MKTPGPRWLRTMFELAALSTVAWSSTAAAQEPAPSTPGAEHEVLAALVGSWDVYVGEKSVGSAEGTARIGGRFFEVEIMATGAPLEHVIYVFGFDRRHSTYIITAMDNSGTYWVSASGTRESDQIRMYGEDEDPVMRAMGLDKEFAFVLHVHSPDHYAIETRWLDTRTEARTEMSFLTFDLRRAS